MVRPAEVVELGYCPTLSCLVYYVYIYVPVLLEFSFPAFADVFSDNGVLENSHRVSENSHFACRILHFACRISFLANNCSIITTLIIDSHISSFSH